MDSPNERLDAVFRAVADPTRRRLLSLITSRPGLTTAQLAALTRGMTRWGVMKHLESLRAAGLIQTLPEGRHRRHYPERTALDPLRSWLAAQD
jgi:DNA-binding transcriptional ArsR family regulator